MRARAAEVEAKARRRSDWKWRVWRMVLRARRKAGRRSQRRRMGAEGQSAGEGPAGFLRKERRKIVWRRVVPGMFGIRSSFFIV